MVAVATACTGESEHGWQQPRATAVGSAACTNLGSRRSGAGTTTVGGCARSKATRMGRRSARWWRRGSRHCQLLITSL